AGARQTRAPFSHAAYPDPQVSALPAHAFPATGISTSTRPSQSLSMPSHFVSIASRRGESDERAHGGGTICLGTGSAGGGGTGPAAQDATMATEKRTARPQSPTFLV